MGSVGQRLANANGREKKARSDENKITYHVKSAKAAQDRGCGKP